MAREDGIGHVEGRMVRSAEGRRKRRGSESDEGMSGSVRVRKNGLGRVGVRYKL